MLTKYWIPGLWLLSLPLYWWAGSDSDTYAIAVHHTNPPYPVGEVLTFIVITTIESLILYAIIRPRTYARSWKRSGAALLLFFPLARRVRHSADAPTSLRVYALLLAAAGESDSGRAVYLFGCCAAR